jgi:hypothetical protein
MKVAVGVDVEDPGVLVESFLKLASLIVVESINVELDNTDNLVVIICPSSHGDPLFII